MTSPANLLAVVFRVIQPALPSTDYHKISKRLGNLSFDALLVGMAVAIIAFHAVGNPVSRQEIRVTNGNGQVSRHTLAIDDPRWPQLHELARRQRRPQSDRLGAMLRWQQEVANLYAELLPASEPSIQTVAYQQPAVSPEDPAKPGIATTASSGPGEKSFWFGVARRCQQRLERRERERNRQPTAMITFGPRLPGRAGPLRWSIAALAGLLSMLAFALWSLFYPPFRLSACVAETLDGQTNALAITIPQRWIRIRQPAAVRIRQGLMAIVVVAALGCLASWWI